MYIIALYKLRMENEGNADNQHSSSWAILQCVTNKPIESTIDIDTSKLFL